MQPFSQVTSTPPFASRPWFGCAPNHPHHIGERRRSPRAHARLHGPHDVQQDQGRRAEGRGQAAPPQERILSSCADKCAQGRSPDAQAAHQPGAASNGANARTPEKPYPSLQWRRAKSPHAHGSILWWDIEKQDKAGHDTGDGMISTRCRWSAHWRFSSPLLTVQKLRWA